MPHLAQGLHQGNSAAPLCAVSTAHRGGSAGRARRVLAATTRSVLRGASAVRSSRTGATVRRGLSGYSVVRVHRDVCEGRADDADVAGAESARDAHKPAAAAIGLHTTRRASSRRQPSATIPDNWHAGRCRGVRRHARKPQSCAQQCHAELSAHTHARRMSCFTTQWAYADVGNSAIV